MKIDLRELRHISTVARLRSFSKAAEALNISQPALSRSVATFEARCGARIFERTSSGIVPTVFGSGILRDADGLLAQAERFSASISDRSNALTGSVSFGMGPMPAVMMLSELIAWMANERPEAQLRVAIDPAMDLLSRLESGEIEFCVFAKNLAPGNRKFEAVTIATVRMGFVVRSSHPLAGLEAVSAEQLAQFPIGTGSAPSNFDSSAHPEATVQCNDFRALEDAVLQSDLIWLTAVNSLRADTKERTSVLDLGPSRMPSQDLSLVSMPGVSLSPLAKEIMERIGLIGQALR